MSDNIVFALAPTSYTVLFTFIELDIEDHFDCRYDWVGLYDGPNDGFPSLRYFCGHFPGVSMVSHGPYMTVIFSSDGSKNDRGYKASFDFVQENDGTCNAMYTTAPGEVTSPNYPFEYPEAVECVTHIQAPMGQIVSLVFFDMGIEFNDECIYDSVIVYDGAGDLAPEIGRFCGEEVPTEELISSGHDMTIVFSSDGSITSTGFRVIFNFRANSAWSDLEGLRSETRPSQVTNQREEHLTHPRRPLHDRFDNRAS
ncbi:bone morphogenetic protein 1-like [Strongylocentrotus purpuratus]|uniref:CUB domain-containing protein n=1 Tax=Strongylocentrotus purpuratus TaxID=7668 RepID=A0A7M7NSJ8_STRPU|nr:bone morphogenetic protein 1-like [Strongylocentrotus purpuratus]